MGEPVCTEVNVSASIGGKMQIVQYEWSQDYHFSHSRKFSVPEDWTERQIQEFQQAETIKLRVELEPLAQAEVDEYQRQRDGN